MFTDGPVASDPKWPAVVANISAKAVPGTPYLGEKAAGR